LGVSTGNMEEGSFRCDANISVRPLGSKELPPKVEVKNMNSFKAVFQAMRYESRRQKEVLAEGGQLVQETRGWVEEKGITQTQRTKEYADDYRYFPEPDLPPLAFDRVWVDQIRSKLPELPEARRDRFMAQYGLPLYDANILTNSKALADYFENCCKLMGDSKAKVISNWLLGDFSRLLNATNTEVENVRIMPEQLVEMFMLVDDGTISGTIAKMILEEMFISGKRASDIVQEKKLSQISDTTEIRGIIKKVISDNTKAVSDYNAGKQQALVFITGQVMKATRGRANPALVNELLIQELGEK
jgi:aspartyl-tRNA(Asn)/glutamyl-tRNA(Gln) amidotransferase subunit B